MAQSKSFTRYGLMPEGYTYVGPSEEGANVVQAFGIVLVKHGTEGTKVRPTGIPVVYWVGTATPVNAEPYDLWYNG